jgi:hypothetical protein
MIIHKLRRHLGDKQPSEQCDTKLGYEECAEKRQPVSRKMETAEEYHLSHLSALVSSWRPACFDAVHRFGKRSGRK